MAIERLPEEKKKDEGLQIELGKAQIAARMKEKGTATLVAVMRTTESPEIMNDCAYELADAGEALDQAEAATRTALEKMDAESKTWTLDENPQVLLTKTNLTVATWDTMGWILYREGKMEQAEDYLNAAWLNDQNAVIGGHLGELWLARGDKHSALTAYELAMGTIPPYDMMGVKKAPGEEELKLKAKAEALKKAGAKSSTPDPHAALQKLRTIPAGPAKGLDGTAEYRLLLSDGKIERAEQTGTKVLDGAPERLKTLDLSSFMPKGSSAKLARNGILNCHAGVCELVLVPTTTILSPN
jgi:tetratricopeptide (TPR) repeat protein